MLSSLSGSRAVRNLLPVILLFVVLSAWTLLYTLFPAVRAFGDGLVQLIYDALPDGLQDGAAQIWHFFLPDFMLHKVRSSEPAVFRLQHHQ